MRIDKETGVVIWDEFDEIELSHSGTPHEGTTPHSGRFPWGSGDAAFQRPHDFYSFVRNREKKGMTETDIATGLNMTTTELRAFKSMAFATKERDMLEAINELKKQTKENGKSYTNAEIGVIIGEQYNDGKPIGESRVRSLLSGQVDATKNAAVNTAKELMKTVDEKGMIDVGTKVEKELGVTKEKLDQALIIAEAEGYVILKGSVEQQGHPGQRTNLRVLAPAGTPKNAIYDYANINQYKDYEAMVSSIDSYSNDNGKTFRKFQYPKAMNPDRVMIRYREEGGLQKDGVIEIRRGVKDLSLGKSNYAQVRILVDNGGGDKDRYLKGMAVYSDGHDMPEGVDIIFNTNKPLGTDKMDVLKKVKDNLKKDPENPFGASIKEKGGQYYYSDPKGEFVNPLTGEKESLGLINKRAEQGEWGDWNKEVPSQFLSKQPIDLINKQLNKSINDRNDEYLSILEVTNPTVKAKLLDDFANNCDSAAVDLKAARLPGARYHVILPSTTLKENEIYAPNYENGTQLALVRFPHAGTFEIPVVVVNNNNKEGAEIIGSTSQDAVMINSAVASRLSGADFDGDTVLAIPTGKNGVHVKSTRALEGLKDFDTGEYGPDAKNGIREDANGVKHYYRNGIEFKHITEDYKQKQMGIVSNLITDMTLIGASDEEYVRAVRHSMVVIDSFKHDLDYRSSEKENRIAELKKKYQPHNYDDKYGGASTLISLSKNPMKVPKRALGKYILDQEGNSDNGNELILVDKKNNIFYDPKSNKVYSEKDKKTVNYDPKTGEKLYRDTYDGYVKVIFLNKEDKKELPAYVKVDDKYYRPKDIAIEEMIKQHPESYKVIAKNHDLYYRDEDGSYIKVDRNDKNIKIISVPTIEDIPKMEYYKDANVLSSGTLKEEYYARYANSLKSLANKARLDYLYYNANPIPYNPEARATYSDEYNSLLFKLEQAERNAPKERQANLMAAAIVKQKVENSDIEMSKDDIQKLRNNELVKARVRYGAKRYAFEITEKEWEAIQAGAITRNRLEQILRYANPDAVRKLATPRDEIKITDSDINRIKNFAARGETSAAIAKRLGISVSTVTKYLNEEVK